MKHDLLPTCANCKTELTLKEVSTIAYHGHSVVRRLRECASCQAQVVTYEVPEAIFTSEWR